MLVIYSHVSFGVFKGVFVMNIVKPIKTKDPYAFSRTMYIIEAALEYFISLVVTDAYLAKVGQSIGMSDSLIGILSAFVLLGCGAQIIAVFLTGRDSVKRLVISGTLITNLAFVLVYLTPFVPAASKERSVILIAVLLGAYLIKNVVHSPKTNWFMSLVDDSKRGVFTANKEIISLIGGMVFTFIMGNIIDAFEVAGNLKGAFITSAATIAGLSVFHILTMVLSREKKIERPVENTAQKKFLFKELMLNKNLLKVVAVSVIWYIVTGISTPFYGSYKVGALGFSMTFISVLGIVSSVMRALCSRPMGRFADKKSFATAMILCMGIAALSFGINIFAVPANGYVLFTLYSVLYAISMAGLNSGLTNLVYDYVPHEQRVAALALQNSIAGVVGFGTTCVAGLLVDHIQEKGNVFWGMNLYAQQVVSAISFVVSILLLLYLVFVIKKISRVKER